MERNLLKKPLIDESNAHQDLKKFFLRIRMENEIQGENSFIEIKRTRFGFAKVD